MTANGKRYVRLLILLIWFGILFTWILSLSQVSMDSGLQIYGSRDHVANQRSVIRVVGVDTKVKYPIPIQSPEYRWRNGEQSTKWLPLEFTQRVAWQAGLATPAIVGIWTLEVRANVRGERVNATTQLNVIGQQPILDRIAFKPALKIKWDSEQDTTHVNIVPLDGPVLRGFKNTLVLTTTPVAPPPRVSYLDARHMTQMVSLTPADVEGVYTFDIIPSVGELVFKIETATAAGTIQLSTQLAYYQIEATPVQTGDVHFSINSRDRDKNILVDLWQSLYWLQTRRLAGEQSVNAVQFSVKSNGTTPFWVQAYNNPLNPIQARGGQFIFTNDTLKRVMTAWLKTDESVRFTSLKQSALYTRFVRGQLSPPMSRPLLIADSSIHQVPELMEDKHKWMKIVAWLLALSTCALIATVLIQIKRHRADLRSRFLDVDSDDELTGDSEQLESSMRDGMVMLSFIAILVTGVTWLFLNARW